MSAMDKAKLHTPDFTEANIEKLAELFPSCVVRDQRRKDRGTWPKHRL